MTNDKRICIPPLSAALGGKDPVERDGNFHFNYEDRTGTAEDAYKEISIVSSLSSGLIVMSLDPVAKPAGQGDTVPATSQSDIGGIIYEDYVYDFKDITFLMRKTFSLEDDKREAEVKSGVGFFLEATGDSKLLHNYKCNYPTRSDETNVIAELIINHKHATTTSDKNLRICIPVKMGKLNAQNWFNHWNGVLAPPSTKSKLDVSKINNIIPIIYNKSKKHKFYYYKGVDGKIPDTIVFGPEHALILDEDTLHTMYIQMELLDKASASPQLPHPPYAKDTTVKKDVGGSSLGLEGEDIELYMNDVECSFIEDEEEPSTSSSPNIRYIFYIFGAILAILSLLPFILKGGRFLVQKVSGK